MIFDVLSIAYYADNKHTAKGWLQLDCPFCGDTRGHLGYHIAKRYFHCYRCGWHNEFETMRELGITTAQYHAAWREEIEGERPSLTRTDFTSEKKGRKLILPPYTKLTERHKHYLRARGFTKPNALAYQYGLLGTGPIGDYRHRIIIPITHKGEAVSFTARDYTAQSGAKYLSCHTENEARPAKDCLLAFDQLTTGTCVVVEGAFDAMRLGRGAVATMGAAVSKAQILLLAEMRRVIIIPDNDKTGEKSARNLSMTLEALGVEAHVEKIQAKDAGELNEAKARAMMKTMMEV